MFRRKFHGGSSSKKGPRLSIREPDPYQLRDAPAQPCEWPSDEFMIEAGFKDEFDTLVRNAGLEEFLSDKCEQYAMLTASFVRRIKFSVGRDSSILFDLYDKSYAMDLEDFNRICKIPDGGSVNDPSKSSVRDFVSSITVGETRDITQATIGSIHFPALHYFAVFIGRCINGKGANCHLCTSDLSILKSAVTGDRSFNMGAIIARRLNKNASEGDFFGGVYATRLANFLGVSIRPEDPPLRTAYLDRVALTRYQFLERDHGSLLYRLIFNRQCVFHITLPAPAFFDFQVKRRYYITIGEAEEYEKEPTAARLREAAIQAVAVALPYKTHYDFGFRQDHPWGVDQAKPKA